MSQNDMVIANQTAPNFRADLNLALQALASTSSGSSAPATTYANMLWYDTSSNILKMRSEADDAWIEIGTLDQSGNTFTPSGIPTASDSEAGVVELSTTAENATGTATDKVPTVAGVGVTPSASKVWINFNGAGAIASRDSYNTSTLVDNATGDYTVNFSSNMADTNYVVNLSATDNGTTTTPTQADGFSYGSWARGANSAGYLTSSLRVQVGYPANANLYDQSHVNIVIQGELA